MGLSERVKGLLKSLLASCMAAGVSLASLPLGLPTAALLGLLAGAGMAWALFRRCPEAHVQGLLGEMAEAAQKLADGDWDARVSLPAGGDGLATLAETFNEAAESLSSSARGLVEERHKLQSSQRALITAEKLAGIGHLAAGVAHEFNNLLAVITGHAQLALTSLSGCKEEDYLRRILDTSLRAATVTRRLLAFARPSDPRLHPVDLRTCITNTLGLAETHLRRNQIDVSLELPDRPAIACVDPRQIEQVLLNLVLNAVDAMPEGGQLKAALSWPDNRATLTPTLSQGERERESPPPMGEGLGEGRPSSCPKEPGGLLPAMGQISVTDAGTGIPPENLQRIFEPFFTTKDTFGTKGGKVGTGLGLAVVGNLLQANGGSIEVESQVGVGSTFRVFLPVDRQAPQGQIEILPEVGPAEEGGSVRALVVDHEEGMRLLLGAILSAEGHRVSYAAHPAAALETLAAETFEVALVEIGMPGLDRERVLAAMAEKDPAPVVVVLSTGALPEEEAAWLDAGAAACLRKPFGISELKATMRRLFPPADGETAASRVQTLAQAEGVRSPALTSGSS